MKRIFRSIINIKKNNAPTISMVDLTVNYKAFLGSRITPESPSDIKLYHSIEQHFRLYRELPSIELLFEKANQDGDEPLIALLKDVVTQTPYIKSDFLAVMKTKFEEQNSDNFRNIVTKTWQIAHEGMKINKRKEVKGIPSAIEYFSAEARKFRQNLTNIKTDSQIRNDVDKREVLESYNKKIKDPKSNMGLFTFLNNIDDAYRGTKLGELDIIAAFVGQGKTTFAANLAYNGVMQGMNGMFVAMEMGFQEMRDLFYVLHTCFPEWYDHHKYKHLAGKISFEKVCYGELSDLEHEFFSTASDDFSIRNDFGELILYQPSDALTPSKLETELYDRSAELKERGKTLDFVIVDYVGLMVADKNERYGDHNVDMNGIIKRLKNLSINFQEGRGLRVVTPFQVNREGWKEAQKNEGVYKLTALSGANEAERAPDHIYSLYMTDDMKKSGIMKITCLKSRKTALFSPFEAHIDFSSRRITDFIKKGGKVGDTDIPMDAVPIDIGA